MRWIAFATGTALILLAFAAATRVADTREGLIAEVVTLLAGVTGFSLLTYAFFARPRPGTAGPAPPAPRAPARPGSHRELALGAAGVGLSIVLVAGLALSGGILLASLGLVLLLPMLAGSLYLCWRSLRVNS